jgi:hypothetical protein
MLEDVIKKFARIHWSDYALAEVRTERRATVDDLILTVVGLYSVEGKNFELRFEDSTYVQLEVDFAFKRVTSDGIEGARCLAESPWKRTLSERNPHDDFSSYLHFEIGLVPKSGLIQVLAKDFSFCALDESS